MNTFAVLLQWGPHRGPHPGPHAPMGPTGGAGAGAGAGMPWGAGAWGMGGGLFAGLVALLLLAILVVGAVYLLSTARRETESDGDTDALAVLKRRYARGEIDDEEFERRRGRLDGGTV
ncbi:hypothetical protein C2R22_18635 [Salinigranum rubrum]|uniref:SHOCT domain-containing protein n=1 Tax=Salinigranum rubrum TaxID=755307 RepID=A0A2I8VNC3_9EURY|nr:SHOCT domain-containing protein [Salinigranum rubrum]AUV83411.1 hypothetical protein C2R22_18635 [Salinigranum rubrum]